MPIGGSNPSTPKGVGEFIRLRLTPMSGIQGLPRREDFGEKIEYYR
jgi:hypothetical protein